MAEVERTDRQVAVVTGASSGIGRAVAIEFARQGYDVAITARREEQLLETAAVCETLGARTLVMAVDTTDETAVQTLAETAIRSFGHFDVWVNAAAVSLYGAFDEVPLEDFRRVIETNFFGYVNGSRNALKQFKTQGHGTLINVSSINSVAPQPYTAAYVASKYAIRGLSETLRMELELEGYAGKIHICNVMPSAVDTNLFQNAANYTNHQIMAPEPVYDPTEVAREVVKLADHPKREVIVGMAGKIMAVDHALMPRLFEKLASRFLAHNQTSRTPATPTTGNLYKPLPAHTGIRGGWSSKRLTGHTFNLALGTAMAAMAAMAAIGYARVKNLSRPS